MAARPRVGLLALTLELYETLAPQMRPDREAWVRQRILPALSPHVDVVFDRAVYRAPDAEAAVALHEQAGADALIVLLLSYAPSQMPLAALQRTRLPIVIWNTQELWGVGAAYDDGDLTRNHGVHGTQDLANVLLRAGAPFHFVTSHLQDPDGLDDLVDFAAAAAAVARLRRTRVGLLGYPFPGMGDFAADTTHVAATLGASWVNLPLSDLLQRADGVTDLDARELADTYRAAYAASPDLTDADLEPTARVELALRSLVEEHDLGAVTYQFQAFGEDPRSLTLPFVAVSRLMAEGIGFAGEGDLVGALGTSLLNTLCPPATFTEMFTIDFEGGALLMSHMGEANVAMARRDRPVPLVARPAPITRTVNRQLALVTAVEPGPATLMALAQGPGGRWRLVVSPVTVLDFGPLPHLCVPHFKVKPAGDVRAFLTAYACAGGPHHLALCFGDARRRLRHAARLMGAAYVEV